MDSIDQAALQHGYLIEPCVLRGKKSYRLIGGTRVFGVRVRLYRASRRELHQEAVRLLAEHHGKIDRASKLSARQRVDAAAAFRLLEEKGRDVALLEVARFFLQYNPSQQSCTVREAVVRFLATRGVSAEEFSNTSRGFRRPVPARQRRFEGYSRAHRVNLASQLRRFVADWGEDEVGVMAAKRPDLKSWLERCFANKTTRGNHRRAIANFFSWAIEEGLVTENPARPWKAAMTSADRARQSAYPAILEPGMLARYLKGAADHAPGLLPYFAIGAFSGIRTEEFPHLKWGDIRADKILASSALSKSGRPREIPIHPTLAAWLGALRRGADQRRVVPASFAQMRRRLSKRLRLGWPKNGLRHSFGSYRYRESDSMETTSAEMRHDDLQTFRRYYFNPDVTKEMADEYWSLVPEKVLADRGLALADGKVTPSGSQRRGRP